MVSQLFTKAALAMALPFLAAVAQAQNTPTEGSAYFIPKDQDPYVDNAIGCLTEDGKFNPDLTSCAHFTRDPQTGYMSSAMGTCSYEDASQPALDSYRALICGTDARPSTFYNVGVEGIDDMICSMGTMKCWQDLEEQEGGSVFLFRYDGVNGGRTRTFMMFK